MKRLSYHNTCLDEDDFVLLEDGCWLNDKLIGFMFEYFKYDLFQNLSQVAFVSPEVSQFIKMIEDSGEVSIFLDPLNLKEKQFVWFAVNDHNQNSSGGCHWSALLLIMETKSFIHLDSMGGCNDTSASSLAMKIRSCIFQGDGEGHKEIKILQGTLDRQQNGYDCGIFVISFIEEICKHLQTNGLLPSFPYNFPVCKINQQRHRMKTLILKLIDDEAEK